MTMAIVDALEMVDVEHQHRQGLRMTLGHVDLTHQRLVHGNAVAGTGQRIAQGALGRGAIEQCVAQWIQQRRHDGFKVALFRFSEALVATEYQFTQVFAFMAEVIAEGVMPALPELQAQITGFVLVGQRIQGHQPLDFPEKQAEDSLWLQAGLQLLAQLLAQLRKTDGACRERRWLAKTQTLQFGAVEVNRVDLGGRFHIGVSP
ncbi:hypothetical protein EMIT043CA1_200029 [Pseudomonas brassicacearum]